MERKIYSELLKWKKNIRKPLLIYGSRQVGKTFAALEFGKKYYKNIVYFNLNNNIELIDTIKKEKNTERLISKLSVLSGETILKEDTLIILDNVNDVYVVNTIKLFGTEDNLYNIIMITSKKENLRHFKGEELSFKAMYPIDFEEFLINANQQQLVAFIKDSYLNNTPMPFHQVALDLYNDYLMIGGYPEVVYAFLNKMDYYEIETIKQKIIDVIKKETIDSNTLIDIQRSNDVINSLGYQLKKENKKFQYGNIKKGSRSKDYEACINYLNINGIIHKNHKLLDVKSPLSSFKDIESFKLYPNDVGILYNMLNLNKIHFISDENIRKILIETDVANTMSNFGYSLYYYQSEGKAEINFVLQNRMGEIIPIEIANTNISKAKALNLFVSKYNISYSIRLTENNFSKKGNIKYIPIYATFCLKDI